MVDYVKKERGERLATTNAPASNLPIAIGPPVQHIVGHGVSRVGGAVSQVSDDVGQAGGAVGQVDRVEGVDRVDDTVGGGAEKSSATVGRVGSGVGKVGEMHRSASESPLTEWTVVGVRKISAKVSERQMRAGIYRDIENDKACCEGKQLTTDLRNTMKTKLQKIKEELESKGKTEEEIAVLKGVWMHYEGISILYAGMHTLPL